MAAHATISPQEAADRLAIRELFDAYAHCADRRDAKGQMALFTEDTRFLVYMDAKGAEPTQELHGRDALAPVFDALNAYTATMHFNGQSNTGNAAASISSITTPTGFSQTNTCGSSLAAGASCSVSVVFQPTAAQAYSGDLTIASSATDGTLTVALSGTGTSGGTGDPPVNLALNQPITASSTVSGFPAGNANDGNTSSYWEGGAGTWPTTLTADLSTTDTLSSVVVDLPPSTAWQTRTQTLSVLGSTNDSSWSTLVGTATYTWNPSTGNTLSINLPTGTTDRYVQLNFTANNVQNAAQVSEFQIYG